MDAAAPTLAGNPDMPPPFVAPDDASTDPSQQQPQPTQPQPTGPDPNQDPELQAAAVHHSRLANAINAVGNILGGSKSLHIVPNSDGSYSVTQTDSTPAEKWGRVAQAALKGASTGFAVGQGPGGTQRAAAAGIATGMAMPQAQQDQTMATAAKYNDQNQKKMLANANLAYLNTRNLEASWALGNNKEVAAEHDEDRDQQFDTYRQQHHLIDVGPAKDVEQASTIYNGNPAVQQAMVGKGGVLMIHHSASQPPHAYIVPEDALTKQNPNEQTGFRYRVDPDTYKVIKDPYTVAAGEDGMTTALRLTSENNAALNAVKVSIEGKKAKAAADAAANKENAPVGTWIPGVQNNQPGIYNSKTGEFRANGIERQTAGTLPSAPLPSSTTFDPAWPPPGNFPTGTEGINSKQIGKVPAGVTRNADLARVINENTDAATRIINEHGDELLGPVVGRMSNLDEMAGSDNPYLRDLAQRMSNIAKASVGPHGIRSGGVVKDEEQRLFNNFRAGKNGTLAALRANQDSMQTFLNTERNFTKYGTATGPDRSLITSPSQGQRPAQAGDTTDAMGNIFNAAGMHVGVQPGSKADIGGRGAPQAPPVEKLKSGFVTSFGTNGDWTLVNGQPKQVVNGKVQP